MSGWGLSSWGLGSWGSLPGPLSVVSALALATRTVRVVLTTTPLAASATGVGDALNPDTWSLTRLDTGFAFTIASIDQVDAVTFDLFLVEALGPAHVTHQVGSTTMQKPTGALIQSPYFATFTGLEASVPAGVRTAQEDVANPPAPPGLTSVGGTLVMTAAGDYALVAGAELLKKLILRRLTTTPGDFAHLPNYGLGLSIKEPLRTNDLLLLQRAIEQQVSLEPDVADVQANLSFSNAEGILTVKVTATFRATGQQVTTSLKISET